MTSAHSVIRALGFCNGERRGTPLWLPAVPLAAQTSSCRTAGRVENGERWVRAPTGLRYKTKKINSKVKGNFC